MRMPERIAEVARLHSEQVANLVKVSGDQQVQLEVRFAEVSRAGLRADRREPLPQVRATGERVGGMSGRRRSRATSSTPPEPAPSRAPGRAGSRRPASRRTSPSPQFSTGLLASSSPRSGEFPFSVMLSLLEANGPREGPRRADARHAHRARRRSSSPAARSRSRSASAFGAGQRRVEEVRHPARLHADRDRRGARSTSTLAAEVSEHRPDARGHHRRHDHPGPHLAAERDHGAARRRPELRDRRAPLGAGPLADRPGAAARRASRSSGRCSARRRSSASETELLVVVTARLVEPLAPHEVPPAPDRARAQRPERPRAVPARHRRAARRRRGSRRRAGRDRGADRRRAASSAERGSDDGDAIRS